ncbi:MAG: histidine kinase [Erysipelotrichaceae bacterium]|nr:histidine kinase [Erysipelotrichaceae bacterium]
MKPLLSRKIIILISSILITSVVFFTMISMTYNGFYEQTVLSANRSISSRWTTDIERRLDTIYEHVYDLSATLFNKTEIRSGSPVMDFTVMTELQDSLNSKVLASPDTTALFILDTESDLYLYYHNNALNQGVNFNLKTFLKQYGPENNTSISSRKWDALNVLENSYYYKAFRLGKYIVGAVSDTANYRVDPSWATDNTALTAFIVDGDSTITCQGDPGLISLIDPQKEGDSFEDGYAITVRRQDNSSSSTILISRPINSRTPWRLTSIFLIADSALCAILAFVLMYIIDHNVRTPLKELEKATQEVSRSNLDFRLDTRKAETREFEEVFRSFNDMSEKIRTLTIESYDLKIKREENRLKMLRAQMRPHTFLNGITTISNMTYTSKPEEMRKFISAFASFTRYMLHNSGDWTMVEEELKHIENYVAIQKSRLPGKVDFHYDCPPDILVEKIPYLTLFSFVENSFKHALNPAETMIITITGERYEEEGFKGFRLIEEDNGSGFTKEALEKLLTVDPDDLFTKEHLGLTNVRYSMNLIYHRDDLLRLSNREEGGARIELLIPEEENDDETAGM